MPSGGSPGKYHLSEGEKPPCWAAANLPGPWHSLRQPVLPTWRPLWPASAPAGARPAVYLALSGRSCCSRLQALREAVPGPLPGAAPPRAVTGEAESPGDTCQPAHRLPLTGWRARSISSPARRPGRGHGSDSPHPVCKLGERGPSGRPWT